MNLNEIFQPISEKLSAFLNAIEIDESGNILLDQTKLFLISSSQFENTQIRNIIKELNSRTDLSNFLSDETDFAAMLADLSAQEIVENQIENLANQEISEEFDEETYEEAVVSANPLFSREDVSEDIETPIDRFDAAGSEEITDDFDDEDDEVPVALEKRSLNQATLDSYVDFIYDNVFEYVKASKKLINKYLDAAYSNAKKGLKLGTNGRKVAKNFSDALTDLIKHEQDPKAPMLPDGWDPNHLECCKLYAKAYNAFKTWKNTVIILKTCIDDKSASNDSLEENSGKKSFEELCNSSYIAGIGYGFKDWKLGFWARLSRRLVLWFYRTVAGMAEKWPKTICKIGSWFNDNLKEEGMKSLIKDALTEYEQQPGNQLKTYMTYAMQLVKTSGKTAAYDYLNTLIIPTDMFGIQTEINEALKTSVESWQGDAKDCKQKIDTEMTSLESYRKQAIKHHAYCHSNITTQELVIYGKKGIWNFYQDDELTEVYAPEICYNETGNQTVEFNDAGVSVYESEIVWNDMFLVGGDSYDGLYNPKFPSAYDSIEIDGVPLPVKSAKWVCSYDGLEYNPNDDIPVDKYIKQYDPNAPIEDYMFNFYLDVEFDTGNA